MTLPSEAASLYVEIDRLLHKIKSQLQEEGGYPYDPQMLKGRLGDIIRGRLDWQVAYLSRVGLAPDEEFDIEVDDSIPIAKLLEKGFAGFPRVTWIEAAPSFLAPKSGKRKATAKLFSLLPGEEMDRLAVRLDQQSFRIAETREFVTFVLQHRAACSGLRVFCGEAIKAKYLGIKYLMLSNGAKGAKSLIPHPYTTFRWDMRSTCLGVKK